MKTHDLKQAQSPEPVHNPDWILQDFYDEPDPVVGYPTFHPNSRHELELLLQNYYDSPHRILRLYSKMFHVKIKMGIGPKFGAVAVYSPNTAPLPMCVLADIVAVDEEYPFTAESQPMYFDADLILHSSKAVQIVLDMFDSGKLPDYVRWRRFA